MITSPMRGQLEAKPTEVIYSNDNTRTKHKNTIERSEVIKRITQNTKDHEQTFKLFINKISKICS